MTAFNGMKGHTRPYTHANGHTLASVTLDANGAAHPDGLSDPAGIVTGITRGGVGVLYITLANRYAKIHALAGVGTGVGGTGASVNTIVIDGLATENIVALVTYNAAGVAADFTDVQFVTLINMYDSASGG